MPRQSLFVFSIAMSDPRDWPEDDENRDPTVIDFPFSLRTNETDAVPDDVVVLIEENPEGISAAGGGGVAGGTEVSREAEDTDEGEETTQKEGSSWWKTGCGLQSNYPRIHALLVVR